MTTLETLWTQAFAHGWFAESRKRPMKSALERYATLLGYADAAHCPVDPALRPPATIQALFETHAKPGLLPESVANQWRSVLNLLDMAAAHGCVRDLPTTDELDWRSRGNMHQGSRVPQHRFDGLRLGKYALSDWPVDFAHEVYNYLAWCQQPRARGRSARIQKVDSTVNHVLNSIGQVAGYAVHQRGWGRESLSLSVLCQASFLEDFCWWWIEKRRRQSTETIRTKLGHLHTIARHWLKDRANTAAITELFQRLDEEAPTVKIIDKKKRWLSLEELDRIARSAHPRSESRLRMNKMARFIDRHLRDPLRYPLPPSWRPDYEAPWRARHPNGAGKNGTFRTLAVWAGAELILRLLLHRPLRIGNICGLEFRHLQMRGGALHIVIPKAELKNAKYFPEPEWCERFPTRLLPHYEEYLTIWRPCLVRGDRPYVFLTRYGTRYAPTNLNNLIAKTTWRYTQDRDGGPVSTNPHLIRTIWNSEMLHAGLNPMVVRRIMSDSLKVLERHYLSYERQAPSAFTLTLAREIAQGID